MDLIARDAHQRVPIAESRGGRGRVRIHLLDEYLPLVGNRGIDGQLPLRNAKAHPAVLWLAKLQEVRADLVRGVDRQAVTLVIRMRCDGDADDLPARVEHRAASLSRAQPTTGADVAG